MQKTLLRTLLCALLIAESTAVALRRTPVRDLNLEPPQPQSTICGEIGSENIELNYTWFRASAVIDCLTSVPFNAAVATRFIRYYNTTLQFHSTSAYLKVPPAGYQQPAVDISGTLRAIQDKIDADYYKNQYAFEADVQRLSQATHDDHAYLYAGVLTQFTFASPFELITVSEDGKQIPEVYIYEDLRQSLKATDWKASPVATINGISIVEYLTNYGRKNSFGMLEPHGDWNQLMVSAAERITTNVNAFSGGGTFYPGEDELTIEFENGSDSRTVYWVARYNSPGFTGPLTTGGDFYNFFVLGLPPANYNDEYDEWYQTHMQVYVYPTAESAKTGIQSWYSQVPAYPYESIIAYQADLGVTSVGSVTGYLLSPGGTAILSIPTFEMYGYGVDTFSYAIQDFIDAAWYYQAQKIIIDLQQNTGGLEALAFEVFR